MTNTDAHWMEQCLALAEQARGMVSPNPLVGAVVVSPEGDLLGEGYHHQAGTPHAEVHALEAAGMSSQGSTLYVSLEPCYHFGRTPPCINRIIEANIHRVVFGMVDPNPRVSGRGIDKLRAAGIQVDGPLLPDQAAALNRIFCHHIIQHRPYVSIKQAMTADGFIATAQGESQWITSENARRYVHYLRAGYDAVLTSASTVMADDCQLTVREIHTERSPIRIILDQHARLISEGKHWKILDTSAAPAWVITSEACRHRFPVNTPYRLLTSATNAQGFDLRLLMDQLYQHNITSIFVEAGSQLTGSFLRENLVQRLYLFYAPKLMGDANALTSFTITPRPLSQLPVWRVQGCQLLPPDWLVIMENPQMPVTP